MTQTPNPIPAEQSANGTASPAKRSLPAVTLASGVYSFSMNDEFADIVEKWSIHRVLEPARPPQMDANGQPIAAPPAVPLTITRSERDGWDADGQKLRIEVVQRGGRLVSMSLSIEFADGPVTRADGVYLFGDKNAIVLERTINGGDKTREGATLPANSVMILPAAIFLGGGVMAIGQRSKNGPMPGIVPSLEPDVDKILKPIAMPALAGLMKQEQQHSAGRTLQTNLFSAVLGNLYDQRARFWIDGQGMLTKATYFRKADAEAPEIAWEVELTQAKFVQPKQPPGKRGGKTSRA